MAKKLLIMYVNEPNGANPSQRIEDALGTSDWARLRGGDVYLVNTDLTPSELRLKVQQFLSKAAHILVSEFTKSNHSGFLANNTVEWINRLR